MATYYVRKTGSDSNAGTSAGAAWATIGKALGASGISAGDTVYIGAGIYREAVTIAMTTSGATTSIIGDTAGQFTGDAGDVILSSFTTNEWTASSSGILGGGGKSNLSFSRMMFIIAQGGTMIGSSGANTQGWTFTDCAFIGIGNINPVSFTVTVDQALNWLFERCFFADPGGQFFAFTAPTSAIADYDIGVTFKNCFAQCGTLVTLSTTGVAAGKPWGIRIINSVVMGRLLTTNSGVSTTNPCTVANSLALGITVALSANASGQIAEDYCVTPAGRTNVPAGVHSTAVSGATTLEFGSAQVTRRRLRYFFEHMDLSPYLGWGGTSVPSVDINDLPRPCGTMTFGDSGTATAGGAKTLTDSGKNWGVDKWKGWTVKITAGTGSGQVKQVASHTATALTVDGNWVTNPSTDSVYTIYRGAPATSGKATAGAATTLTDSNAAWGTNQWTGFTVAITSGTGSGQTNTVTSNTGTVMTVPTWGVTPDTTSVYVVYRQTDENTVNTACGCFERGNTLTRDTGTVRTGSYSLRAFGPAVQDFDIPVSATATTITVYVQWDSTYAGTKPSMSVLNGEECGVAAATATATGSAGSWEQLSLTFTPTANGIVTVRLQSSCTSTLGSAYFDDFSRSPRVDADSFDYYRRGEPLPTLDAVASGGGGLALYSIE